MEGRVVHREHRDQAALALRRLASARITNREFENQLVFRSPDAGVRAVIDAAWSLYDDLREHRLTGKYALTAKQRRAVARAILFLHSSVEYHWPANRFVTVLRDLLSYATRGWIPRAERRSTYGVVGDAAVWPFFEAAELTQARRTPRFGTGFSSRAV
jgi:hypothetical protein